MRKSTGGKKIRIIGVQAEDVAPLSCSKVTGRLRYIPTNQPTIADGVNVKVPGGIHDEILFNLVDEYVGVPENEIAATVTHCMLQTRTVVEGAGCVGLAALIYGRIKVKPEEKVAIIVCGGNIDVQRVRQVHELGVRALSRALTVEIRARDDAGQIAKIVDLAAQCSVTIRNIRHSRFTDGMPWDFVSVTLYLWTSSFEGQIRFLNTLVRSNFDPVIIGRSAVPDADVVYAEFDKCVADHAQKRRQNDETNMNAFIQAENARASQRTTRTCSLSYLSSKTSM